MKRVKLFSLLAGAAAAMMPLSALAVTLTEEVELILPSTSEVYNLHPASTFDTLDVTSGTFTFTLSDGQSAKVSSRNRRPLTNSQSVSTVCGDDKSEVTISVAAGAAAKDITITPGTGACGGGSTASTAGGGSVSLGGGGGGGGSAPIVPQQVGVPAPAPAPAPVPAPVAAPSFAFTGDLAVGSKNKEVTQLQILLAQDKSIYPEGLVTGYFGGLTRAAVVRFQAKHGIAQVGRVGPLTRAKLNELMGPKPAVPVPPPAAVAQTQIQTLLDQIKALQAQVDALKAPVPSLAPAPVPAPVPVPPPPSGEVPAWMKLYPVPRAGGASVVDPSAGAEMPWWMNLTPADQRTAPSGP